MRKMMMLVIVVVFLISMLGACAPMAQQGGDYGHSRYNTQKGALGGAVAGALAGQAIGRNTESALIGVGVGALIGALAGNVIDQNNIAAREAARTGGRVIYCDGQGGRVEAEPVGPVNRRTNCRKVRKTTWKDGKRVGSETEEVCEASKTETRYLD